MSPPPRDSPSIRTDDELNAKRRGVVAFAAIVAMPRLCECGDPDFARVFPMQANTLEEATIFPP
jgi:hypothetical protein